MTTVNRVTRLRAVGVATIMAGYENFFGSQFSAVTEANRITFYGFDFFPSDPETMRNCRDTFWIMDVTVNDQWKVIVNYNNTAFASDEDRETVNRFANAVQDYIDRLILESQKEGRKQAEKEPEQHTEEENTDDVADTAEADS